MRLEPTDYAAWSDTRPDLTADGVGRGGGLLALDLKVKGPVGSDGLPSARGALVAFGNTRGPAREEVHGLLERGRPGDKAFNANTGAGRVEAKRGQYTRAETVHGVDVRVALVETLGGGLGPELCSLIRDCAEQRQNRLSSREYDDTTWAARTWHSFTVQKLSVAIQRAMALEIAHALGLSTGADPRAGM